MATVLVCESEPQMQRLYARRLKAPALRFFAVATHKDLIEATRQLLPDIVVYSAEQWSNELNGLFDLLSKHHGLVRIIVVTKQPLLDSQMVLGPNIAAHHTTLTSSFSDVTNAIYKLLTSSHAYV